MPILSVNKIKTKQIALIDLTEYITALRRDNQLTIILNASRFSVSNGL